MPFFLKKSIPIVGEVELENLPLKREALRHIGLPVEIKAGFIGKIRLQVPVRQIRTASWVIGIEQLYVVAGPINLDEVRNVLKRYVDNLLITLTKIINKTYRESILYMYK